LAGAAGGVGLSAAADSVQIKVFDGNGALVQTLDLGKQDAGLVRFVWDGSNASGAAQAAGDYSFKVDATAAAGATAAVTASAYALGNVLSVSLNDNDMSAEVSGLGARSLNQIRQIF
jgi:flagellar basal-body rod modification protein FlgD